MADKVLELESEKPLDVEGWEQSGQVNVRYPDGSLWEHRSYQSDFDKDGNYEVVTGRVLLEPAPEPVAEEAPSEGE